MHLCKAALHHEKWQFFHLSSLSVCLFEMRSDQEINPVHSRHGAITWKK